jgi:UDP-N-acetyl-D-galactosamine dehydrogenase
VKSIQNNQTTHNNIITPILTLQNITMTNLSEIRIAVIGLGYVGLPLARLFATKYPVVGYDINKQRVAELMQGIDSTLEVDEQTLKSSLLNYNPSIYDTVEKSISFSSPFGGGREGAYSFSPPSEGLGEAGLFCSTSLEDIRNCNFYIVTVPTPVDKNNRPDLTPLVKASETVGKVISKGDIVVYESTVYPGATEEDCVPVVEKVSGLTFNVDFFAGYSPERINPGDKEHTVEKIKKVTSGSTPEIGEQVDAIYRSVITAGTHLAPTIKVAESAKVIENSQRDINIAFVNELAKIFNRMNIDTHAVLEAAGTKWNFLPFKPGLVGGHCIGVDPFYLAQKAQEYGYHPEIILAGRRMNDSMGPYVASEVVKLMIKKGTQVKGAKVLMLGITFKENCPDIRNTKAIDIYNELREYDMEVDVYDPWADPVEVKHEYGIKTITKYPEGNGYGAIILAVAHREFLGINLQLHKEQGCIIYDVKCILNPDIVDGRL